jgi:hypothetical protein
MDTQGHVSAQEVRIALRSVYSNDPESNLEKAVLRSLADNLKPVDETGRWKPNPLLILFLLLACALAAVFFYFTLGGQR